LRTGSLAVSLALLRAVDVHAVTVSGGLELGALVLRQSTAVSADSQIASGDNYLTNLPGQLGTTTTWCPFAGPIIQVDLAISPRLFARLDGAVHLMVADEVGSEGVPGWRLGREGRLLAGMGIVY
jgi:hypothetical protein